MAECLTIEKYCGLLGKIGTPTASTYISKLNSIKDKTDKIQISWETTFKITRATKATIEQQSPTSRIKITGGITASDISDDYVEVIPTIDCNNCENILALEGDSYFNSKELEEQQTCAKDPIPILKTLQGSADAKIEPYAVTIPNPYIFPKSAVLLHGDYILEKAKLTSSPTGCATNENLTRSEEGGVVTITYTAELPIKYGVCVKHLIKDLLTEIAIEQEFTDEDVDSCTLLSHRNAKNNDWYGTRIASPLYFLGDYLCGGDSTDTANFNAIIGGLVSNGVPTPDTEIDEIINNIYVETYYYPLTGGSGEIAYEFETINIEDYQARGARSIEEYLTEEYNWERDYYVIYYENEDKSSHKGGPGIFPYQLACIKIETNSTCGMPQPSKLHFKLYSPFTVTTEGISAIRIKDKEKILTLESGPALFEIPVTAYGRG